MIHHANRKHLYLSFLRKFGHKATRLFSIISQGWAKDDDGWRSNVSADIVAALAKEAGPNLEKQFQYWEGSIGVPRYNDIITVLCKDG